MIVSPLVASQSIRGELVSSTPATTQLKRAHFTCQMTFDYYLMGSDLVKSSSSVSVSAGPTLDSMVTIWRTSGAMSWMNWTSASVYLDEFVSDF